MRKALLILGIGLSFVLLLAAISSYNRQNSQSNKGEKEQLKLAFGDWSKKQSFKPSKGLYTKVPPETWGELTDLNIASKLLGFNIKLPNNPRATAAGAFKIYLPQGEVAYAKNKGISPKPDQSTKPGASAHIYYPNGLIIEIKIRHPQDPTKNYERFIASRNSEYAYWSKKGFKDGKLWQATSINGFEGMQIEAGFNYMGPLMEHETPNPALREPRPAVIIWYDNENWAEYRAYAPIGVSLKELREVVDSIYQ